MDGPAARGSATRPEHPPAASASRLADHLEGAGVPVGRHGDLDVTVSGFTLSTARVLPGDLYAALPGTRAHGADFADQEIGRAHV